MIKPCNSNFVKFKFCLALSTLFIQTFVLADDKAAVATASGNLTLPSAMELDGIERRVEMVSPLGPIELRWERSVERLFVRTPERAVIEAANAVRRALSRGGFPVAATSLTLNWHVIFFDEKSPDGQVPVALLSGCHPGWMIGDGKNAHIYVRARAVASGCDGGGSLKSTEAEGILAQVMIHEIGHGVEQALLGGGGMLDRSRSEGFATWFEQYVSAFSPLLNETEVKNRFKKLALMKMRTPNPFQFQGTAYDYAYASMMFSAIEERFGVRGLFEVYDVMLKGQQPFVNAIESRFHWNQSKLAEEIARLIK